MQTAKTPERGEMVSRLDLPVLIALLALLALVVGIAIWRDVDAEWKGYQHDYAQRVERQGVHTTGGRRIEQAIVSINGRQLLDRCQTCHLGVDNPRAADFPPPLRTHPPFRDENGRPIAGHNVRQLGCIVCHAGNGRGLRREDAHGHDRHWLQPLRTGARIQASCAQCHDTNVTDLRGAPVLARGRRLFQRNACWACHQISGISAGKVGPILTAIADRRSPAFIEHAIRDPKDNGRQPDSQMPRFDLSDDDVEALVVFLSSQRRKRIYNHATPASLPMLPIDRTDTAAAQGQKLFHTRGCSACHSVRTDDRTVDGGRRCPELTYAGRMRGADYVRQHIRDPRRDVADSIMPPFVFLPQTEVDALTAFLMARKYRVTAAPTASKRARASQQFATYCSSCHGETGNGLGPIAAALDPKPKNFRKRGFVLAYAPRFAARILNGVPGTAMPPWQHLLTPGEADELVAYIREKLAGAAADAAYVREARPVPAAPTGEALFESYARGRRVYMRYCIGCHGRQGSGKGPNAYDILELADRKQDRPQGEMLPRNLRNDKYHADNGILTRQRLSDSIRLGVPGTAMPAWTGVLDPDRILDLISFVDNINRDDFAKRLKDRK